MVPGRCSDAWRRPEQPMGLRLAYSAYSGPHLPRHATHMRGTGSRVVTAFLRRFSIIRCHPTHRSLRGDIEILHGPTKCMRTTCGHRPLTLRASMR